VAGLGAEAMGELPVELCCAVGWTCPGLDRVAETVGEGFCDEGAVVFDEGAVVFAEADDPRGCTDATAEAAECGDGPPLHAAVSKTKTAMLIRRRRFPWRDRPFVLGGADRRGSSAFNSPPSPPSDDSHSPRD
jgi:hypothetical protein